MARRVALVLSLVLGASMLSACAQGGSADGAATTAAGTGASSSAPASGAKKYKVALVGDQRFGDLGPMDDMARGLEKCATEFGFETKKFESIETAAHEDDVRAVARDGYDMVFTTFPDMTPATTAVAAEFPDTKFTAIYQFINVDGAALPNVWDTEFRGDSTFYIAGAIAATLSKSGKLGYVAGTEDPTINAALNGYIKGAKDTRADAQVEAAVAGSWEDPAKGKDIAKAMASRGVDVVTTAAAKTQLGVLDGAKETGMLFIGDVADNSSRAPATAVGYVGSSFGQNVYLGCKSLADGSFTGGKHTFIDLTNGGYFVPYDAIEAWGKAAGREADATKAIELGKEIEAKVKAGTLEIPHKTDWPKS